MRAWSPPGVAILVAIVVEWIRSAPPAAAPPGVGLVRGDAGHPGLQHALLVALHLGDVDEPAAGRRREPAATPPWAEPTGRRWPPCCSWLIAAALWAPRLRGPLDLRYDAGVYYVLGTSLAEGQGYRLLNEPGAIQAVQYPPVLPLVAAVHQRVLGTSDPAVVGHWLRIIGRPAAFWDTRPRCSLLGHRFLPTGYALLGALLAILHAQTLFLSDSFAADVPYALFSSLFFLAGGGRGCRLPRVTAFGLRTAGDRAARERGPRRH